jgi:hypothetical protein
MSEICDELLFILKCKTMTTATAPDRADLLNAVAPVLEELQQTLASFSGEALNKIPFTGSWTAGQVIDHLLKSYGVVETLNGKVAGTQRDPLAHDEGIRNIFLDFSTKLEAPDFIIPDEKIFSKQQQMDDLKKRSQEIIHSAETLDLSLTCLDFELPTIGHLTRAEWLYFVSYHTRRHIRQLKNIARAVK